MKNAVDILSELGLALSSLVAEEEQNTVVQQAVAANEWFTYKGICTSIGAIVSQMLSREKLEQWLASYSSLPAVLPKRLAIIMAGNIPLVGLQDLICAIAVGHRVWVKPSSKDRVLMEWVVMTLRVIEPKIPISYYDEELNFDVVIATGGEAAVRYFTSRYDSTPILSRGNRHSIAVLSGAESAEEMSALADDIYTHSGLGCRNVSMMFTPRGVVPAIEQRAVAEGYLNNYRQRRAVMAICGGEAMDNGISLFVKSRELPSHLSTISIYEYDSLEQVQEWIASHDEQLQCIVTNVVEHPRRVAFGEAQHPSLADYADGVDTVKFLISI